MFKSLLWCYGERLGAQCINLLTTILLARILEPKVFGQVAIIMVFTAILNVFVNGGFGNALIQKKDADELDFSSVFFFNIGMSALLYTFLFITAPFIAQYFKIQELKKLIRVLSLTLLSYGIQSIQIAYISRKMLFQKFFFATLGGTIISGCIGILMAIRGLGVWSLVTQTVINQYINTIILWYTVKWHPKLMFSIQRLQNLFDFGWKLLVSSLVSTSYNEILKLIVGKKYTVSDLAYYSKGALFPEQILSNINTSMEKVLFPTMSKMQTSPKDIKEVSSITIKISTYILMPLMIGLACCAKPFVTLILTEKWIPCIPYLRIFCVTCAFYPIHTVNLNAIKALGKSDIFLRLEIIKKTIGLGIVCITMWFGVIWIAYSMILTSLISQIINSYPNKKLLDYSYKQQISDMVPQIILSLSMGVLIYFLSYLKINEGIILLLQFIIGVTFYIGVSHLFNLYPYEYIKSKLLFFINKYKKLNIHETKNCLD